MTEYTLPQWHYLHGQPDGYAILRTLPEDFIVEEALPFTADGEGEHHLLQIRKRLLTTHQVAQKLASFAGVKRMDVSWAGLKDKYGVTSQWFSVRIPGKETPDWTSLNDDNLEVLQALRHGKKLRTGTLSGNRFVLTLRQLQPGTDLERRLEQIRAHGVPNYFGEQRFGHGGRNVERAAEMFAGKRIKDRNKRSIYLSAARSFLFNQVVSERLSRYGLVPLAGDTLMMPTGGSFFKSEPGDAEIPGRLQRGELRLSAPMAGEYLGGDDDADRFEQEVMGRWPELLQGLKDARMDQERRPLLLCPQQMSWQLEGDTLVLSFLLPAGAYATSVLRELVSYEEAHNIENQTVNG
ncbi:tRNA pseudouridine(13) synthase TruD [Ferrimonas sediminicola]|uniref:tRNA pseudouridine synthase D n=1 Tax=Ferrimonas sediminicola TaxID=2569538 RepID=A0A4U1BGP8_9GAMM|nr:tRNA pseudouridine(13) synthase TruD [Ferrimonas sediminicola]TKB49211.1 tRNA pseudouridine(13) synthase TruD [Ferrimonas sediminicola]